MSSQQHPANPGNITYRDLEARDIAPLSDIVADIWESDAPDQVKRACGTVDLAAMAARATFGQVAEVAGRAVGAVFARAGRATSVSAAAWAALRNQALESIEASDPDLAGYLQRYQEREERFDAELLTESDEDDRFELVLFIVSNEMRGRGIGAELLSQAEDYLKSEGAAGMFLFTDSGCTWQYYEKKGMRRSAYRTVNQEGEELDMYVYATDFE